MTGGVDRMWPESIKPMPEQLADWLAAIPREDRTERAAARARTHDAVMVAWLDARRDLRAALGAGEAEGVGWP